MIDQRQSDRMNAEVDPTWEVKHISASSTPSAIRSLRRGVTEFACRAPFSAQELGDLELAVGEACTNAFKHGSPLGDEDEIRITCMTDSRTLIVEISDCGEGFDADSVPAPKIGKPHQSGMGIFLMKVLMDTVEFEYNRGTTVRMTKCCKQAASIYNPSRDLLSVGKETL